MWFSSRTVMVVETHPEGGEPGVEHPDPVLEVIAGRPGGFFREIAGIRPVDAFRVVRGARFFLFRLDPQGQRVGLVQAQVMLPVELDRLAIVRAPFEIARVARVGAVPVILALVAQGKAQLLLPEIIEQGKPRLGPERKLLRFQLVVRVVAPGAAGVVEVGFGIHVPQDDVGLEVPRRRDSQPCGDRRFFYTLLLAVPILLGAAEIPSVTRRKQPGSS